MLYLKVETILGMKDASIWVVGNGLYFKYYASVALSNNLDKNQISDQGCNHISKGKWPFFRKISLGKCIIIKAITKSAMRDINTSVKDNGLLFNNYNSVPFPISRI